MKSQWFFDIVNVPWSFSIQNLLLWNKWIENRGALGYFLGGYVPPGTPNWHPVLEKISPKIDTPF